MRGVFNANVVDENGNIMPGSQVEVLNFADDSRATIYGVAEGGAAIDNPITTGPDAFVQFYAPEGRYKVVAGLGSPAQAEWVVDLDYPDLTTGRAVSPFDYGAAGDNATVDYQAMLDLFANEDNIVIPQGGGFYFGDNPPIAIRQDQVVRVENALLRTDHEGGAMFTANGITGFKWLGATRAEGDLVNAVYYEYDGKATAAGTTTTIVDSSITPKEFAECEIHFYQGLNNGSVRDVSGVSGGTITFSPALPNPTAIGDEYKLVPKQGFIQITDCDQYLVEGVNAEAMKGPAFRVDGLSPQTPARGDQGILSNCQAIGCTEGFWFKSQPGTGGGAEYNQMIGCNTSGCVTGTDATAGNTVIVGGNDVDNQYGFVLRGGTHNHAHGITSARNINHNAVFNLHAKRVTLGHTFNGCHFYGNTSSGGGAIFFDECGGMVIDGGHWAGWVYCWNSTDWNYMRNVWCSDSYGDCRSRNETGDGPANFLVQQNMSGPGAFDNGIPLSLPGEVYSYAERAPADLQDISGGLTTLTFPSVNIYQDKAAAFRDGTTYTCPPNQTGMYRVDLELVFSGTGLNVDGNSYVQVRVNGQTPRLLLPSVTFQGTILTVSRSIHVFLNAGDAMDIQASISGTDQRFGAATAYTSSISIMREA